MRRKTLNDTVPGVLQYGGGLMVLVCLAANAFAQVSGTWNVDSDGNWSTAGNWTPAVPNGVDDTANFGTVITETRTVMLDIAPVIGAMTLSSPHNYTLSGANPLTFRMTGSDATLSVTAGTNTVTGSIALSNTLAVTVTAGAVLKIGGVIGGEGGLAKAGSGDLHLYNDNRQHTYAGPTVLSEGTLIIGDTPAWNMDNYLPPYTAVTIAAGATQYVANLGTHQVIGSLSGAGTWKASGRNDILTFGTDNTDTTFSGTWIEHPTSIGTCLYWNKVGNGTFTQTASLAVEGGFRVADGTWRLRDMGKFSKSVYCLAGAVMEDDDTGIQNANRWAYRYLGGGGEWVIRGCATNDTLSAGGEQNYFYIGSTYPYGDNVALPGEATITLIPGEGHEARLHHYNKAGNHFGSRYAYLVRGDSLGETSGTRSRFTMQNNLIDDNLVGGFNNSIPSAPANNGYGTPKICVLIRAFGDTNSVGNGSGFVTYDGKKLDTDVGVRLLLPEEYSAIITGGEGADPADIENKRLSSAVTGIDSATLINSLLLEQGGSVAGVGALTVYSGMLMSLGNDGAVSTTSLAVNNRMITLVTPEADDRMTIDSVIQTSGGLIKAGHGTVILAGNNDYSGETVIGRGALRAVDDAGLPTNSWLRLAGGVLESSGTLDRTLGSGAGKMQWWQGYGGGADGGLAAAGGDLVVQLNGGTAAVTWGGSDFIAAHRRLVLGSVSADSIVDFQNDLDLGTLSPVTGSERTIHVPDNPSADGDRARISGTVTNAVANLTLVKTGDGTLELAGTNTYHAATDVREGTLLISGSCTNMAALTIRGGATLAIGFSGPDASGTVAVEGTLSFESGAIFEVTPVGGFGFESGSSWTVATADGIDGLAELAPGSNGSLTVEIEGSGFALVYAPPPRGTCFILR